MTDDAQLEILTHLHFEPLLTQAQSTARAAEADQVAQRQTLRNTMQTLNIEQQAGLAVAAGDDDGDTLTNTEES